MRELINLLKEAADLLLACGVRDVEQWFRSKAKIIEDFPGGSAELHPVLKEISHNLVGMGSFSDIVLKPRVGSTISREEAEKKQARLIEEIGENIDSLLRQKI